MPRERILQELHALALSEPFTPFKIISKSGDFAVLRREDLDFMECGDPKIRAGNGQMYALNSQWISIVKIL